ncbi:MAG: helix-turn-helix domain-containing protein [Pseudonocardiaceae bacterium]
MSGSGRLYCTRCGARLRRGQPAGSVCDPCARARVVAGVELPWGGYVPRSWQAALGVYDFGSVFQEVRAQTGWSQQTLGALVDLSQAQVSAVERGTTRLVHVRLVSSVARGLNIPGSLLGFPDSTGTAPNP